MKTPVLLLTAICSLLLLDGCGGSSQSGPPAATRLSVTGGSSANVGTAFNVTVSALDASGQVVPTYAGTVHFSSSDGQAALPADSTLTNGTKTFPVTFKTAGSQTVTVSDTTGMLTAGKTGSIAVSPGAVAQFSVTPSSQNTNAGSPLTFVVTALDVGNNPVPGYAGTVHFTSSDAQAGLPADSTLPNGTKTVSVTLKTAGNQTVTATDTVSSLAGTSSGVAVSAGPAVSLSVKAPTAVTTGFSFSVTVSAVDTFGNVAPSYAGTVHFTSSDPQATLPTNSTLNLGTGGFPFTLVTISGNETISAADTVTASLAGASGAINVVTNAATHLSVTPTPAGVTTRQNFSLAVTALDAANNQSKIYTGTVHFTSSDTGPTGAKLPANSLLPGGNATLTATLEDVGSGTQTVAATDTATSSITGSTLVSVVQAQPLAISSSGPPNGTLGTIYGQFVTVTEYQICTGPPSRVTCNFWSTRRYPLCKPHYINLPCWDGQTRTVSRFLGFAFQASGGVPGYTWSATSMPPGLSLLAAGQIVGTPTSPGTYNIGVTATDAGNPSAQITTNFPFTIALPAPPTVNSNPLPTPAVVSVPYTFTFSASGYPPFTWSESGQLPPGLALSTMGVLSGTPTTANSYPITVTATDQFKQNSAPASFTILVSQHGFQATGSLPNPVYLHTATLLGTGNVLVAGGQQSSGSPSVQAYLFNPATGTFASTGNLGLQRAAHSATLLSSGKVLVAGGLIDGASTATATAELYDPTAGTFSSTGSLQTARSGETATLLSTGRVLIVGGQGSAASPAALNTAEIYDPVAGTFTQTTGNLQTARFAHTATLLASGKVLIAGGMDASGMHLASAELFDPMTETFTTISHSMTVTREGHTATLLSTGDVLVAGGFDDGGTARNTAELFDPTNETFTAAANNMLSTHANHSASVLADGTVLLAGGLAANGSSTPEAETYSPSSGAFAFTGPLVTARQGHTATSLTNGHVLVTGGLNGSALASAEVYQ